MQAMVLHAAKDPLLLQEMRVPIPNDSQVLIKIIACGVCRTDLHIIDGELSNPKLPLVPGHEIVGLVVQTGRKVTTFHKGDIVGVPWLAYTCGTCKYCRQHKENLCENALFTGYTVDGGYAQFTVAYEQYCFHLHDRYANASGAPLLCAGLIGYRSYSKIDAQAEHIGIYGFGAAAHILVQVAVQQHKKIYAFTRDEDIAAQQFALQLGAVWAGNASTAAPVKLDAAIIFAPVGSLIPKALQDADKGATIICGGIHMSDIPAFPYALLWHERCVSSVANLTRKDGEDFFKIASEFEIKTNTKLFALEDANTALQELREGKFSGAAVLIME